MVNFIKNLFLTPRLFWALSLVGTLFLLGYFFPAFFSPGLGALLALGGLLIADAVMLFAVAGQVECRREAPGRFSNGDDNAVGLMCRNTLPWPLEIEVIDELPVQFQVRDFSRTFSLPPGSGKTISYTLRPTERGVYRFGAIHSYASGPIGLLQRRFSSPAGQTVKVYPSYIQMRRYELLAISNRLSEAGIKRIRRLGHTMEFDQIREYVRGDDYRTINWKATARRHALMVNHYQDERSQQVYAAINMGRVMKMPFAGLTLLDYAINASLVISNIALLKQDKAGIITFSNRLNSLVEAQRRPGQMNRILETLYHQETDFLETDYRHLAGLMGHQISRRSLVLLFSNFETRNALKRQLPFLQSIAARHLLVVIFFENTGLTSLATAPATNLRNIYVRTIANQFQYEKRLIVKELQRHGIQAILTAPENLTVNTINHYLYLKARGLA